jgi:phosphoglucosamine mutase
MEVHEIPGLIDAIEKREATLAREGRILVRPSGTEPVIRVMVEGQDKGVIDEIAGDLCDLIISADRG